eukprot:g374.t1
MSLRAAVEYEPARYADEKISRSQRRGNGKSVLMNDVTRRKTEEGYWREHFRAGRLPRAERKGKEAVTAGGGTDSGDASKAVTGAVAQRPMSADQAHRIRGDYSHGLSFDAWLRKKQRMQRKAIQSAQKNKENTAVNGGAATAGASGLSFQAWLDKDMKRRSKMRKEREEADKLRAEEAAAEGKDRAEAFERLENERREKQRESAVMRRIARKARYRREQEERQLAKIAEKKRKLANSRAFRKWCERKRREELLRARLRQVAVAAKN